MIRRVFTLSAMMLSAVAPIAAQRGVTTTQPRGNQQVYQIRGVVVSADTSAGLEFIKVELLGIAHQPITSEFTRTNGQFTFNELRNGVYRISVDAEGYEPVAETVEIFNASRVNIVLYLKKGAAWGNGALVPATISSHELSISSKAQSFKSQGMERLYGKNDPEGSLRFFQKAVEKSPGYYEAYFEMGMAYFRLKRGAKAEESFRKAAVLSEEKFGRAQVALAAVLADRNEFAEAENRARQALESGAPAEEGSFQLARALFGLGKLNEAEKALRETLKAKPDHAGAELLLANIHIRKGDYAALLDDLETYLRLQPTGPQADQARKLREKLKQTLAKAKEQAPTMPRP